MTVPKQTMIERPESALLDLAHVRRCLTADEWASDRRLILFGVRCARRALIAAKEAGIPVAEVTVVAIDTLERYAKGEATAEDVARDAELADRLHVPVTMIVATLVAEVGRTACWAPAAGTCAAAGALYAERAMALVRASQRHERAERLASVRDAVSNERYHRHAALVDLFCVKPEGQTLTIGAGQ
jgi:hypothetical protein